MENMLICISCVEFFKEMLELNRRNTSIGIHISGNITKIRNGTSQFEGDTFLPSAHAGCCTGNVLNVPEVQMLYMLVHRLALVRPYMKLVPFGIQVGVHYRVTLQRQHLGRCHRWWPVRPYVTANLLGGIHYADFLARMFPLCWRTYPLMFARERGFISTAPFLTFHSKCIIN
jgi:hypothetical protein